MAIFVNGRLCSIKAPFGAAVQPETARHENRKGVQSRNASCEQ